MAVKKHTDGTWLANFRLGGRGTRRIQKTGFPTKDSAQLFEIQERDKFNTDPFDLKRDKRRLSDIVDSWQNLHGRTLKDPWRYDLLKTMTEDMSNPLAVDFSASHFADYQDSQLQKGNKPSTINRRLALLKAVFNTLIRLNRWVLKNPLSNLQKLPVDEFELNYLETDQISILIEECFASRNNHLYPVVMICLSTGARWGEAQSLTRQQVKDGIITFNLTKAGKSRSVPISSQLQSLIFQYSTPGRQRDRLFDSCKYAFRSAYNRAGLLGTTPGQLTHILRHTFASHFIMNGGHLLTLQKILGHSSLTITMRYAHLAPDFLKDAINLNPVSDIYLLDKT